MADKVRLDGTCITISLGDSDCVAYKPRPEYCSLPDDTSMPADLYQISILRLLLRQDAKVDMARKKMANNNVNSLDII